METATHERLPNPSEAFDHPVTKRIVLSVVTLLGASILLICYLQRSASLSPSTSNELQAGWVSWMRLSLIIVVPILLNATPTIILGPAICLLGFREYARATEFIRERALSPVVVAGILLIHSINYVQGINQGVTPHIITGSFGNS